jgi:serine/threonine-protein kinase
MAMQAPSLGSLIGQQIGNYKITRELGRGGMGVVYEAVHTAIGYRAAVKVLGAKIATDPKHKVYVSRFLDEARAVNLILHPGVVRIFDMGETADGTLFILMEFLEGPTLHARILAGREGRSPRFSLLQSLRLIRQIAQAMAAAHDKGILHRDLKPDNVVLIADEEVPGKERVKILDFGLARFLDSPERRTTAGVALGTPTYMSPEQCMGDELDGKSDVYTLGVILYELLVDQVPFPGDEMGKVMRQHVDQQPRPVRERAPGTPLEVAALAHSMLEKRREQRPDMRQVAQRIEELENTGRLGPTGPVAAAGSPPRAEAPTVASKVQQRPAAPATELVRSVTRPSKPKLQLMGAMLAVGMVAGLGLGLGLGSRGSPPPPRCPPAPKCPEANCPAPTVPPVNNPLAPDPGTDSDAAKGSKKKAKAKKPDSGHAADHKKSR